MSTRIVNRSKASIAAAVVLSIMAPLASLRAQSNYATPYTFTTLAGTAATPGGSDGTGGAAGFYFPSAVAVDGSGNVYVADTFGDTIRMITPAGVVTTIAGSYGKSGSVNGTGSAALFNNPQGIALDSSGNIYVADSGNYVIRKIASGGVVTTLAGAAGVLGSVDATGSSARFGYPVGMAVDGSGNIYVADAGNNTIRLVTPGGSVTTYAGSVGGGAGGSSTAINANVGTKDGTGAAAQFNSPEGCALDSSGNLFVADTFNNTIRKIAPGAVVTTYAGTPSGQGVGGSADGTGAAAQFDDPTGVAVDSSGNLYVADCFNATIRKVAPGAVVTTIAGTPKSKGTSNGTGAAAAFNEPTGITVDSSGNVYVADTNNDDIRKGTLASGTSPTPTPTPTGTPAPTPTPTPVGTAAPAFTVQPASVTIASGSTVVFNALASNSPTYQWSLNGSALTNGGSISGATSSTLEISGATSANAGSYSCVATNSVGSATSTSATLTATSTTNVGRLTNISCRAEVGTGGNILIAGFAVGGSGTTGSEPLLIRASGPALALAPFSLSGTLADPQLSLYSGSTVLGTNNGWGGSTAIVNAAASVGAFPWSSATSHDAALLVSEATGAYTAQIAGQTGDTGIALAEVYDVTPTYTLGSPRLVNISARVQVGTGGNILIAGFVIGGTTAKTVLIRASGPALALAPFSLSGTLADPELELYSGQTELDSNNGWGGNSQIASTAASVGAFPWSNASSHDSALLVTLPPGAYTAQVLGASGDTGVALVELYEVP